MSSAELPEIRDLPSSVLMAVGEEVRVYIHDDDSSIGPVQRSSDEMVRDLVHEMLEREGLGPNRKLELLCALAARTAVGKLAASSGFTIEYGGNWMKRDAREVVEVRLRTAHTPARKAETKTLTLE
jgi:hypothetical protein